MKFQFATTKKAVAPVKKPFNMAAAEEALENSFARLSDAAAKLGATEGVCEGLLEVASDSMEAIEAFSKFGAKHLDICLHIYNGKSRLLDTALGMETIAEETLAKMDAASKKLIAAQYKSALEANVGDAFKAFYEKAKTWFAEFMEWIKEFFTGNAKLLKMVQEAKFDGMDIEAQINGVSYDSAKELIEILNKVCANFPTQIKNYEEFIGGQKSLDELKKIREVGFEAAEKGYEYINAHLKQETKTIKELGWDEGKAAEVAKLFAGLVTNKEVAEVNKKTADIYKKALAEAISGVKEKVDALTEIMKVTMRCRKDVAIYGKAVRVIGVQLLRMAKKAKSAPAEAEGEAKEEPKAE